MLPHAPDCSATGCTGPQCPEKCVCMDCCHTCCLPSSGPCKPKKDLLVLEEEDRRQKRQTCRLIVKADLDSVFCCWVGPGASEKPDRAPEGLQVACSSLPQLQRRLLSSSWASCNHIQQLLCHVLSIS